MHSAYCQNSISQINDLKFGTVNNHYDTKIPEFKLKEKSGFPDNFPLQLGGEYGYGRLLDKSGTNNGKFWNAIINIHLYSRILFLKVEAGGFEENKLSSSKMSYGSLGLNVRIMKKGNHKIFFHGGVIFSLGGIGLIILSSRYMYSINKYIGLSIGPRFMFTTWENADYQAILAGIQIFTN